MIASRRIKQEQEEVESLISELLPKMEKYKWHCDVCKSGAFTFVDVVRAIIAESVGMFERDEHSFQSVMGVFKALKKTLMNCTRDMERPAPEAGVHMNFDAADLRPDPDDLPN